MENQTNIPAMRFPEFSGDWEMKKLGEISTKISDGLHSTPIYDDAGEYYFINGNNLNNGEIIFGENTKRVSDAEYIKHRKDLNDSTILLSINGTIGSLALYNDEKVILGKSACYININKDTDKYFIYYSLQSLKVVNFLISELTGSTIKNLSLTTIKNCNIDLPIKDEQTKIATFLTAVDDKLTQLKKKKTLLEQYKKGVMQKIFSQEIRFKDDDGKDFPDWEEKMLGEVSEVKMGQSPDSRSYNANGDGIYLIQGNADISNRKSNPRNWTNEPTKECKIGDLILTVRAPVGAVAKSIHNACIGRGVCSIRNNLNSNIEFLYQFLLGYEPKWVRLEQGSTFTAVSGTDIKSIEIPLPTLQEQAMIANFLSALDNKINHTATQIDKTQQWKKGLLQIMFV